MDLVARQCAREKAPLPEKFANAPELLPGLDLYYSAFFDLSTCRPLGFAEGPIPWLAIDRYCEANDIEGEQREDLHFHVRALDRAYLQWRANQQQRG